MPATGTRRHRGDPLRGTLPQRALGPDPAPPYLRAWPAPRHRDGAGTGPAPMVAAFDSFRFVIKGSLAGAAVYVAYDQGLLGSGTQGAEALRKAQAALPPAIQEWTSYIGWELPPTPKFDFSPSDSWNKGVQTVMSALSVAPTRACEYTVEGWKYVKDLVK
ncbi:PREDICTED: MICOS complex subunit MIC13 [Calidris pugnax]|uniref:MICOS complex subunit MIC13 n=1 Tax=Calidris pugnax TaxID=198806 RepID=UPI00071DC8F1|nr:PREDICTED: MICOS complex subunit MIC13 [Calidris pugnax]